MALVDQRTNTTQERIPSFFEPSRALEYEGFISKIRVSFRCPWPKVRNVGHDSSMAFAFKLATRRASVAETWQQASWVLSTRAQSTESLDLLNMNLPYDCKIFAESTPPILSRACVLARSYLIFTLLAVQLDPEIGVTLLGRPDVSRWEHY